MDAQTVIKTALRNKILGPYRTSAATFMISVFILFLGYLTFAPLEWPLTIIVITVCFSLLTDYCNRKEAVKLFFSLIVLAIASATLWSMPRPAMGYIGVDSKIFHDAVRSISNGGSPYDAPRNVGFPFIYALCMLLGEKYEAFSRNLGLLNTIGWITAIAVAMITYRSYFVKNAKGLERAKLFVGAAIITVCLSWAYVLNQVFGNFSGLLAALSVCLILCVLQERYLLVGMFLGLMISIKPYFITIAVGGVIHWLLRKDKKVFLSLVVAGLFLIVTFLVIVAVPGGMDYDTYKQFITDVSRTDIPRMCETFDNASIYKAFEMIGHNLGYNLNIRIFSLVAGSIAYAVALCKIYKKQWQWLELCLYCILLTNVIFPLTWMHYYCWLLMPNLVIFKGLIENKDNEWLVPSFFLCQLLFLLEPLSWLSAMCMPVFFIISLSSNSLSRKHGLA